MNQENKKSVHSNEISSAASLGKEIKISPKALVWLCKPGLELKMYEDSVQLIIGIGNDHSGILIMSVDSWKALQSGEKVNVSTIQEFKKKAK